MVENVSATGSVEAPVTRHTLDNHNKVAIDDARLLFQGDYAREGHDLLISHDGRTVVVENYFIGDDGPSIAGPNGAFLSHETVSALAGPLAPAQYAQAGAASGLVEIGKIVKLTGSAKSQHPDGTEVELALDAPVYQGDVLSTGPDSSLGISFIDESVFSMSADARMVLDELVYDPGDTENSSMVFNLVEGAFVFVTGEIAPTGNMKVETPVATMGIRGTTPKVLINTALGVVEFTILPDPDSGHVGVYQIVNRETGAIMGTVESSGDKWVVTTLTNEAVRIAKTGLDLLNDQIALDEIRDVFSRALGDRTQLDGTTSFSNVSFDSSSSDGNGNGEGGENGQGGGAGGNMGGEDGAPTNDSPPIAIDDFFAGTQNPILADGSNVIDGIIGGGLDTDPDGFPLKVTQVNGVNLDFVNGTAETDLPSGSKLSIKQPGSFEYNPNGAYDFLGSGDQDNDVFTYTIRDVGGFTDTATVTITITGTNDRPVITQISTTVHDGDITEDTNTGSANPRTLLGSVTFTDVDASDTHTASVGAPTVMWAQNGGANVPINEVGLFSFNPIPVNETPPDLSPNLEFDANGVLVSVPDPVTGDVGWTYTVVEGELDFLAAGETLTLVYPVTITDNSGASGTDDEPDSVTQNVTVTVTGTNDVPVIQSATGTGIDTGAIIELTDADTGTENNFTHTQTGTIAFDDVDVSDTHTLTSTPDGNNPANLPSATFAITQPTTTDATTNGTFGWTFTVDDADLDFLAEGETRVFNYTLSVDDDNGGIDSRTVTVTITGTNDAPVITVGGGDNVAATLAEAEAAITASGSFSVGDVDVSDVVTVKEMTVATSGNDSDAPADGDLLDMMALTPAQLGTIIDGVSTTGNVGWIFNSGTDQFDYLAVGEQLTLTYTVTVTDDNGAEDTQDIAIVVTGTNDAPVISLETGDDVSETLAEAEAPITASGSFSVGDVDVTDVVTVKEMTVATSGNVSDAPGNTALLAMMALTPAQAGTIIDGVSTTGNVGWIFNSGPDQFDYLAVGEQLTLTYTVTVTDDNDVEATQDIAITVTGANDAPVADADSATTDEDVAVTIDVLDGDTDVDNNSVLELAGFTQGANGTVTRDDNGTPSDLTDDQLVYTPDADFSGTDTFDYTIEDEHGATDTQTVTVTVDPVADAPGLAFDLTSGDLTPVPASSDVQVNTTTAGDQEYASIAALPGIGFVVVWTSSDQDGSGNGVFGQIFDLSANPLGGEFQINSFFDAAQENAAAANFVDGSFLVAWESQGQDGSGEGVFARYFDSTGTPTGPEFQVNSTTSGEQYSPAVVTLAGGGVIITWNANGQDGDGGGIFAQLYDASENAVGTEFQVNSFTTGNQFRPTVASLENGGFVVSWTSSNQDGGDLGVFAQIYDGNGDAVGSEFQLNTHTNLSQEYPAVIGVDGGGFVAVWASLGQDGSGYGIFGQRFDASGNPIDAEFQVNSTSQFSQFNASIAALDDGGFVVAWNSDGQDGDGYGRYAQRFDANGNTVGDEFRLNDATVSTQVFQRIGADSIVGLENGQIVALWDTEFGDGEIFARIFDVPSASGGIEDNPVPVPMTSVLADADGSETLSIILSGFPAGASFNLGAADGNDWLIDNAQAEDLSTLVMTPPTGWDGTFTLSATARATEGGNGDFSETAVTTDITIVGPNDAPNDAPEFSATGTVSSDEMLVNEHLTGTQNTPQTLRLSDGRVLFTFRTDDTTDGDTQGAGIAARIGTVQGDGSIVFDDEFRVNEHVVQFQQGPQAIELADGRLLFAFYTEDPTDGDTDTGIASRIGTVQGDGSIVFGEEFRVNELTTNAQFNPEVTELSDGRVIFTYYSFDTSSGDTSGSGIVARVGAVQGNGSIVFGSEFLVNEHTDGGQVHPRIEELADGRVLFTFATLTSADGDTSSYGIAARIGTVQGDGSVVFTAEFQVNEHTSGTQAEHQAIELSDGRILFTFFSSDTTDGDASAGGVSARIGTPQTNGAIIFGDEFRVNDHVSGGQNQPQVIELADGRVLFVFTTNDASDGDTAPQGVSARIGDVNGDGSVTFGDEFRVNDNIDGVQHQPQVVELDDGRVLFVFTTYSSAVGDGSASGIVARVLDIDTGATTAAVTEIAAGSPGEGTTNHTVGSSLGFTDVNQTDAHTVSATANGAGYLGVFSVVVSDPSQGDGSGQVTWTFEVNDGDLAPLADGEIVTQSYDVTIDDGEGGTATETVEITLVGANDAPVVVAGGMLDWQVGDGAQPVDAALTVNDVDSPMLIGGTVTISNNFDAGQDMLGFVGQNEISGNPTSGPDNLVGGAGSDIIFGLAGNDTLVGGDERDILVGGEGADTLTGGNGSDIFVFDDLTGLSVDNVLDFNVAEDFIDLEALLSRSFDPDTPGDEISFSDGGSGTVVVSAGGAEVANLGNLNVGDTINIIHDQAEAAIAVQISLTA